MCRMPGKEFDPCRQQREANKPPPHRTDPTEWGFATRSNVQRFYRPTRDGPQAVPYYRVARARTRIDFMKYLPGLLLLSCAMASGEPLHCDFTDYRPLEGLEAESVDGDVVFEWTGSEAPVQAGAGTSAGQLRARFGLEGAQPVIRQMAALSRAGHWAPLVQDARPQFHVAEGKRRISYQQLRPMQDLGREATPEVVEQEKWKVFWDAPLNLPGLEGVNPGLPRDPSEVTRSEVQYSVKACRVRRDGVRLEISFDGLTLGSFEGSLRFTVYKGSNLVRQEAVAATTKPSVAYVYRAGLGGLKSDDYRRLRWRDIARDWQHYRFGGGVNEGPVPLRARNRVVLLERERGALAIFPPSHKFFFAREIEMNLGYVWYRQGEEGRFDVGVRQAEREEMFRPWGASKGIWEKRVRQSRAFAEGNFALYNAPPGTLQRMAVYYYLGPRDAESTLKEVLAYTHGDKYKPLDGHQVAVSHFHTHFAEQLVDLGSLDARPPWVSAFRGLGINIAMMSDFHGDGHPQDEGEVRFRELGEYFEACRRHSDKDFLLLPGEEPNVHFGGHYTLVFPRPVYWSKVRGSDKAFQASHPEYGTVYRVGSAGEMLSMLETEKGLLWQAHPRTKGSTFYPDVVREAPHFLSDRYLGGAFQSLPADLSKPRICEERCFGTLDDMNNWAGPKYMIAEGDTYTKYPEDEIYPHLIVNYVRLSELPAFDEDWSPITEAMRRGEFFVSTGEVLIPSHEVEGFEDRKTFVAEVEWTFPLEFVELVWGDGKATGRQVLPTTDLGSFGRKTFRMEFDSPGKKWVRFAAWDSAGNGAFTQPIHLSGR